MLIELYIFGFITTLYGLFIILAIVGFNKLKKNAQRLVVKNNSTPSGSPVYNNTTSLQISDPEGVEQNHSNAVKKSTGKSSEGFISIVVSARNEEKNIEEFLQQLINQNFPKDKFELILVDDDSDDNTFQLAKSLLETSTIQFQIIQQAAHQGKKKNIAKAIDLAKGSIIITSDADVVARSPDWLSVIAHYFETEKPDLLIMPIDFENSSGFLPYFQILENMALTGITAGYAGIKKAFMCNGANLAFQKNAYASVNGYTSHLDLASGEDVFLLEAIKKLPFSSIQYLLSNKLIVKTKPILHFKEFFYQRVRWSNKVKQNTNPLNFIIGLLVIMANLLFPALLIAIITNYSLIPYLSIFVAAKLLFDFLLLFLASNFLGRLNYIKWFILFECVYWLYAIVIGLSALFVKPYWKEKKIT